MKRYQMKALKKKNIFFLKQTDKRQEVSWPDHSDNPSIYFIYR